MTHLEQLIVEYLDWKGYFVKHNVKVGKRAKGGWEMELDIVAFNPEKKHLIHLEPSLDAHSWVKREARFTKKFEAGKKYILADIFKNMEKSTEIEQCAILVSNPSNRAKVGGGNIKSVDEYVREIRTEVHKMGIVAKNAIPEQYPVLRTIQLLECGYYGIK